MQSWKRALKVLEAEIPKSTFQTWFADTSGRVQNDQLIITVHSAFASEWLKDRFLGQIKRAVNRTRVQPLDIRFVIKDPSATEPMYIQIVNFDPTRKGFVQISCYAVQFWQPYIGLKPFSLWVAIRSYAWYARRAAWPTIRTLSEICFRGNRQQITGRLSQGQYYTGALETLEVHRIVWYTLSLDGRYIFNLLDNLPLLTPEQVQTLRPHRRKAHRRFLRRCELDFEQWSQLTLPSLANT